MPARLGVTRGRYVGATLHRPSNVDDPATLRPILEALAEVSRSMPVILPLHPRTRRNLVDFGFVEFAAPLRILSRSAIPR